MMRKKIIYVCCCFLLLFSLPAMAAEKVKEVNTVVISSYEEVLGREYQMTAPFTGNLTLGFDVRGRIYGSTGLNRFWGEAGVQNGKIKISDVYTTENKGVQEQRILQVKYLTLLKDAESIHLEGVEGETLVLTTPFQEKLIFTRIR